jgi:hypothetical protein
MIYTKTVTASSGGTAAAPADVDLPVTNGLIYQFELYFPPGSSGLLFVRVSDGAFPVWPSEPGEWYFGDNTLISFPDRYYIQAPDHRFKIWYYNSDDTYDHKFQIRIGQVSAELFIQSFIPTYGKKDISEVLEEMQQQQEKEKAQVTDLLVKYFTGNPDAEILEDSD